MRRIKQFGARQWQVLRILALHEVHQRLADSEPGSRKSMPG
jgi:hypothetical protein